MNLATSIPDKSFASNSLTYTRWWFDELIIIITVIKNDRSSNYPHQEINNGINVGTINHCTIARSINCHTHVSSFSLLFYFIIENLMRAPLTIFIKSILECFRPEKWSITFVYCESFLRSFLCAICEKSMGSRDVWKGIKSSYCSRIELYDSKLTLSAAISSRPERYVGRIVTYCSW